MALMKHRGLFELLEAEGPAMLSSSFQSPDRVGAEEPADAATESTRVAIETMLEELAPNLWEDDLDRLVDFGHLISPELEMVMTLCSRLIDLSSGQNTALDVLDVFSL
jgi:3-dehydroquinate synthase